MSNKNVFQKVTEGTTDILVYTQKKTKKGPGTKKNLPFYNPSMELNRDLSIVIAQWFINRYNKEIEFLDGLASSGIRGIRFVKELEGDFKIVINDWNENAYKLIKKNLDELKINNVKVYNKNLNTLLSEKKFDYIDIDPFGSPAIFVDSSLRSIKNNGIIACTATDTATLCGVHPKVCYRRYGSIPFHSDVMKEVGLRILIGFICREAGKYDKGIMPLVSYGTDHYFRVYLKIVNGVTETNKSVEKNKMIKSGENVGYKKINKDIGPLYLGKIQNKKVISDLIPLLFNKKLGTKNELYRLLDLLYEESDAPAFFYTTDSLASYFKASPPKIKTLFNNLKKEGYNVYRTHFGPTGFKTDATLKIIEKMFN